MPAMRTARNPEPCATVATPYTARIPVSASNGCCISNAGRRLSSSHRSAMPPAMPRAHPTAISTAKFPNTTAIDPCLCVASWTKPRSRAMPAGSLNPDSPSRMAAVRPVSLCLQGLRRRRRICWCHAAPRTAENFQSRPKTACETTAIRAVVAKVPSTPMATIGTAASRNRRRPRCTRRRRG